MERRIQYSTATASAPASSLPSGGSPLGTGESLPHPGMKYAGEGRLGHEAETFTGLAGMVGDGTKPSRDLLQAGAGKHLPVVFDFDNTIISGDIGEATLAMLEQRNAQSRTLA